MYLCIVFDARERLCDVRSQPTRELAMAWLEGAEEMAGFIAQVDLLGRSDDVAFTVIDPEETEALLPDWVREKIAAYRAKYAPAGAL